MRKKLNMINIVPAFLKNPEFNISEIKRQAKDARLNRFALCLSFHPEGTPAANKIPILCNHFRKVSEGLKSTGIELGILIQSTQGHGWNGKVPLTQEPWQQIVYYDGKRSPRMCSLDPGFRDYVVQAITECVRCNPAFLLVDDDFGPRYEECFCPLHVAKYNEMLGKNYTREEMRKMIDERPYDDPEVKRISQGRYDAALEYAKLIRKAIDSVNPDLRCGLCLPECRNFFGDSAKILAGKTEPFVRIGGAWYGMSNLLEYAPWTMQEAARDTYHASGITECLDETDTFPQNYYSESAAAFHSHICTAILNGLSGCKLWTSEFNNPADSGSQRRYEAYLGTYHDFYEELFNVVDGIRWQGPAGLKFRLDFAFGMHPVKSFHALTTMDWCRSMLAPYAFPVRYAEPGSNGIYTLCGEEIGYFSDDQIRQMLSASAIIDSVAAKELTKRGFAKLMGVEATDGGEGFAFSREIHAQTGLGVGYMWEPMAAELKVLSPDVKVVTNLCNGTFWEFHPVAPGMTFFTNELGGRVVVTALSVSMPFYKTMRPPRRVFLQEALDFLAGGLLEMSVENADQQVIVRHGILKDGTELLALHNIAVDALPSLNIRLKRDPVSVKKLSPDGTWSNVAFERISDTIIRLDCELVCCLPQVFRFEF